MTAYEKWISYYTIIRKEVVRLFRIWPQTFLPSLVTSTLYFLIFGAFLGSRIGEIHGVPYIMFVVPGLVMLAVVMNSYMNTSFVMFQAKFFMRTIDEILVSPTPPWVLIAGYISGGLIRGVVTGILVLLVALFFTNLVIHSLLIILLFLLLSSLVFALAGLVNGIYAKTMDAVNIVPTFVIQPLVYLGGIFYSTSSLPPFWASLTKFDPLFYIVNGFRYGFLGISDIPLWMSFAVLGGFIVVLTGINLYLLKKGLGLKQ